MTKIPYTIEEMRETLQARVDGHKGYDSTLDTLEWENTLLMILLLHIYDGLDIIDTRVRNIESLLIQLHTVGQDAKGEGETPVP